MMGLKAVEADEMDLQGVTADLMRWTRMMSNLCPRGLTFTWWGCCGLCF